MQPKFLKSFDTFVSIATTSTSLQMSVRGPRLIVMPFSIKLACRRIIS